MSNNLRVHKYRKGDFMENLQSKFQKGLSSVQKGLEEGKNKFQTSQEVINLRNQVEENQEIRTSLILSLGELAYEKIRNNELKDETVDSIGEKILELDKNIFDLLKIIEEKTKEDSSYVCECGTSLTLEDKFCKSCGKKVEIPTTNVDEEKIICNRCKSQISISSKYCNCCGMKLS